MDKRKSMILVPVTCIIVILGVALVVTQNGTPASEEEPVSENGEPTDSTIDNYPFNATFSGGDFNFTRPPDGNFTFPEGDLNFTRPSNGSILTPPDGGFQNSTFPFMGNLTDEQTAIVNEKMQELRESGATQEEIMAAMQELMEEFGIKNP